MFSKALVFVWVLQDKQKSAAACIPKKMLTMFSNKKNKVTMTKLDNGKKQKKCQMAIFNFTLQGLVEF